MVMKRPTSLFVCLLLSLSALAQLNSFTFNINGQVPPGFEQALKIAGQRWTKHIDIKIPIKVNVFTVNTNLVPASAITLSNGRQNFANAPLENILYPTALANQLANSETNPGEYDMDIYFNLYTSYYFGNGKPPSNQQDLITTAMHEIGHGLGFYSDAYVDASNIGSFGNIPPSAIFPLTTSFPWRGQDSVASVFDTYIVKASGNHLVTCAPQNSSALGDSIRLSPSYFSGPIYASPSHSNTPIRLSGGTGAFGLGTDLLHIHQSYLNTVMSYGWGYGDTVRAPAHYEMGILKELGWKESTVGIYESELKDQFTVFPNPCESTLIISGQNIHFIVLYDALGNEMERKTKGAQSQDLILEVDRYRRGIYMLKVEDMNGRPATKKIVLN
jgi:hypothetical protein